MSSEGSAGSATVIVPFAGSDAELRRCLEGLQRLALRDGDEVLVADNRSAATRVPVSAGNDDRARVRVVAAPGRRAPGCARNRAAAVAGGEWLVFVDADARPAPDLLDGYFTVAPEPRTGILAGAIVDVPGADTPAARHSARRGQLSQRVTLDRAGTPYAQSANLAVRRSAFAAVGGFDERARAGEDADLCFRLAAAGWGLEERPRATVHHETRATLAALAAQLARHGSGAAWLDRRYPGEFAAPGWPQLARRTARAVAAALSDAIHGRGDHAADDLVELIGGWAFAAGRWLPNRARRTS